jgi:hypothetical protein
MAPAAQPYRPRVLHLMADYLESQVGRPFAPKFNFPPLAPP